MTKQLAYSMEQLTEVTPFGRSRLYAAIREGRLVARKFDRRTVVLHEDLMAFLTALEVVQPTDAQ